MIFFFKNLFSKLEVFIINFYESIVSIIKIFILSKFNIQFPSIQNENCLILGNGPSLNKIIQENENLFCKYELICLNHFPVAVEFEKFKPSHLVWLDSLFFNETLRPMEEQVYNSLLKKTTWKINLFVPVLYKSSKKLIQLTKENPNINVVYFNYTIVKGFTELRHFFYSKNLGMPQCQNVLIASIFLAVNLKFKQVYLLGADHTYFKDLIIDDNNEIAFKHAYFFPEKDNENVRRLPRNSKGEKVILSDYLFNLVKTFRGFFIIKEYSEFKGVKVFNSTEGSYIDAFDRFYFKK